MIGGNINAMVQVKTDGEVNEIGERLHTWNTVATVNGFLDYSGGQNDTKFDAKIQDTTHMFLCDYQSLEGTPEQAGATSENARMLINGENYEILLIDDPMNLHQHLEIYLKYLGGGLGA